ncbi:hypothetical protein PoB_003375500 [Plakobranchus ocellatus]|uniref:Uncharacterized protein n=1 Tax=Plakobranchus ocellatus TaxID=259542 RepID=A0AAV4AIU0_9GAST|nr:hypothetical protein PoB_003375500 [Plakobranchus ocellatus]
MILTQVLVVVVGDDGGDDDDDDDGNDDDDSDNDDDDNADCNGNGYNNGSKDEDEGIGDESNTIFEGDDNDEDGANDNSDDGIKERIEEKKDGGRKQKRGVLWQSDCIWGDQAEVRYTTNSGSYAGDCAGFIDLIGKSVCSDASVGASCCKTCGDLHTGIAGCEYGDTYPSCNVYTQAQICDNYSDICCLFCQGYKRKRSSDSNGNNSGVTIDPSSVAIKVTDNLKAKPDQPNNQTPPHEEV